MSRKKSRRHALGQHFLKDPGILDKIVRMIDPRPEDLIVEIGAGTGVLTSRFIHRAGRVIAIERDPRLIPELKKLQAPNLTLIEADVLKLGIGDLVKDRKAILVGNLPYSISTPILFKVLDEWPWVTRCYFLLQKEVAERICAQAGSKKYSPLSILFQNRFSAKVLFVVPPGAFTPPPKVDSSFIALAKLDQPLFVIEDEPGFRLLLKTAFRHRRKKLANNLSRLPGMGEEISLILSEACLEDNLRAEQIPLEGYVTLHRHLIQKNPDVFL